jgi:hypothetical protein
MRFIQPAILFSASYKLSRSYILTYQVTLYPDICAPVHSISV